MQKINIEDSIARGTVPTLNSTIGTKGLNLSWIMLTRGAQII